MSLNIVHEAERCSSCIEWTRVCGAECCRLFVLTINNLDKNLLFVGSKLQIKKALTQDKILYYKLHGAQYAHGILTITLNNYYYNPNNKELHILDQCEGLTEDLKCKYHNTIQQPKICSKPNINENKNLPDIILTPKCLYNYKNSIDEG
jgi:hypothetical protein